MSATGQPSAVPADDCFVLLFLIYRGVRDVIKRPFGGGSLPLLVLSRLLGQVATRYSQLGSLRNIGGGRRKRGQVCRSLRVVARLRFEPKLRRYALPPCASVSRPGTAFGLLVSRNLRPSNLLPPHPLERLKTEALKRTGRLFVHSLDFASRREQPAKDGFRALRATLLRSFCVACA